MMAYIEKHHGVDDVTFRLELNANELMKLTEKERAFLATEFEKASTVVKKLAVISLIATLIEGGDKSEKNPEKIYSWPTTSADGKAGII